MAGFTRYSLTAALTHEWAGGSGLFRLVNLDPVAAVTVSIAAQDGSDSMTATAKGDSLSVELDGVRQITIEADAYPALISYLYTSLPGLDLAPSPTIIAGRFYPAGIGGVTLSGSSAEALAAVSTLCQQVSLKADPDNTGTLYVGFSGVTAGPTGGMPLEPGAAHDFPWLDLADLYVIGTAGDSISYTYWT